MWATCVSTVFSPTPSAVAIAPFERPSAMSRRTAVSRSRELDQRVAVAPPADEHGHDLWIDRRAAARHPPNRVEQLIDVGDPVLEQITDAGPTIGEEAHGMGRLDGLRQDDDRRRRGRGQQRLRRPQPLVREGRWHADVHDRDVGPARRDQIEQRGRIAHGADDLEPTVPQHAGDAFAQQDVVLG